MRIQITTLSVLVVLATAMAACDTTQSGGDTLTSSAPTICSTNADCAPDELCDWDICFDGECGACDEKGVCEPRPATCEPKASDTPVCACDGTVYDSKCLAKQAGVRTLSKAGACDPPAGTFTCGPYFCALDTEVCLFLAAMDGGTDELCMSPPAACAQDDCDCLVATLPAGVISSCSMCSASDGATKVCCDN